MSKVATIEKITKLEKHPNADSLDILTIGAWQVVAKQGQYKEGDLVVYIYPDSVVDALPAYDFLKNKHYRIKQIKLRGVVSNGLCLPMKEVLKLKTINDPHKITYIEDGDTLVLPQEGLDVAHLVGAKHYEKEMPACLAGKCRSTFPSFLRKTDEDNLRSNIKVLEELQGKEIYISAKLDGSSATYYLKDGQFGVCSRNMDLLPDDTNSFWKVARKYDLENKMKKLGLNIAIQGELVGPGIQKNKLGLSELEFGLFNVYDINNQQHLGLDTLIGTSVFLDIPLVHILYRGVCNYSIEELIKIANELKYPNGSPAEGIVIRPTETTESKYLRGRMSVKVISEVFADLYKE